MLNTHAQRHAHARTHARTHAQHTHYLHVLVQLCSSPRQLGVNHRRVRSRANDECTVWAARGKGSTKEPAIARHLRGLARFADAARWRARTARSACESSPETRRGRPSSRPPPSSLSIRGTKSLARERQRSTAGVGALCSMRTWLTPSLKRAWISSARTHELGTTWQARCEETRNFDRTSLCTQ